PTATAPESSSSRSHPPGESATATALPTAAAPPPVASATPVPVPTAAVSAQLMLLPKKPRAASRSTCRDRFMRHAPFRENEPSRRLPSSRAREIGRASGRERVCTHGTADSRKRDQNNRLKGLPEA